jgi:hypothetical protein
MHIALMTSQASSPPEQQAGFGFNADDADDADAGFAAGDADGFGDLLEKSANAFVLLTSAVSGRGSLSCSMAPCHPPTHQPVNIH